MKKSICYIILSYSLCNHAPISSSYQYYTSLSTDNDKLLESLKNNDFPNNTAIVETLLIQNKVINYSVLIEKDLLTKKAYLENYLSESHSKSTITSPDQFLYESAENMIISSEFSESEVRQRLLNNIVILEDLLTTLGQEYGDLITSNLTIKQAVFGNLKTLDLLKTLLNKYRIDQLLMIIRNSRSDTPTASNPSRHPVEISKSHPLESTLPVTPPDFYVLQYFELEKIAFSVLKSIAPDLCQIILDIDSLTSKNKWHIKIYPDGEYASASVRYSLKDGFPQIIFNRKAIELPYGQLQFIMAHELAHYVLEHYNPIKKISINHLLYNKTDNLSEKEATEAKKMFELSEHRVKEYEADEFAILGFRTNIDDAINWAEDHYKKKQSKENEISNPSNTFSRTHPLTLDRIKRLKALRIELQLGQRKYLPPIDLSQWINLAKSHLEFI